MDEHRAWCMVARTAWVYGCSDAQIMQVWKRVVKGMTVTASWDAVVKKCFKALLVKPDWK